MRIGHDRVVYVGDGSSDVHVMLHVNRLDGLTIAVSEKISSTNWAMSLALTTLTSAAIPILRVRALRAS